jgi:NitT/TauT family transport system substrate-binding protein
MINQICNCCGISRRDFLKLSSLFTASAGLSLAVNGCTRENTTSTPPEQNTTTTPSTGGGLDQPVKIGYLPILDASPLLIAHARKEYEAQGLTTEEPVLFRSWASIVEAFLAKQINVVHLLSPITVWLRYGQKFPGKIVAWNHTDGSALTVLPEINTVQDLGGKTIAVPFWYSIHNLVLQQLLKQANLKVVTKSGDVTLKPDEVALVVMPPPEMVWESQRIDFQPYPFPSYTENLITLLKETQVEGEATFLQDLDPKFVAIDLVDDTFVKNAIAQAGGFQAFNIPESFTREEKFAV